MSTDAKGMLPSGRQARFARFAQHFPVDWRWPEFGRTSNAAGARALRGDPGLIAFLTRFAGKSFKRGVYRALRVSDIPVFTTRVAAAFPAYADRICPFAYDWLSRIYCVDFESTRQGQPTLTMFSHLTDEVIDIPLSIDEFHDECLVDQYEAALDAGMFERFLAVSGARRLKRDAGVSLKLPLFLNGEYAVENMEMADVDVDWWIATQLRDQTRDLAPGAVIGSVSLNTG